jgi:hypothetical protein
MVTEGGRAIRISRIRPEGSANYGTASGERSSRPPDMKCRDVAVPDRLLPPGVGRDPLDREIDLDESFRVSGTVAHLDASMIWFAGTL